MIIVEEDKIFWGGKKKPFADYILTALANTLAQAHRMMLRNKPHVYD